MLNCPCYNHNANEGWCLETRDYDICFCGGNPINCDFFPAVRQQAIYSIMGENKEFVRRDDVMKNLISKSNALNVKIPEWVIDGIMEA